ncbi:MAG: hypothetical protein R2844_12910 [Caldilineales bacterium]
MSAPAAYVDPEHLQAAVQAEFFWVLGLEEGNPLRRALTPAIRPALRRFAEVAAPFDRDVAEIGISRALRSRAPRFIRGLTVSNAGLIPPAGPLLLLSNHPGGLDLFLILAMLPRDDVRIIVSEISILRHLPATGPHFISIGREAGSRMQAVRAGISHLKQGGALFIFPGGILDPDPAFMPGAVEALDRWSPSVEVLLRRAPQANVVVGTVGGVLSQGWYRSPVTRLRQERKDRQKVAEVFQTAQQLLFPGSLDLRPTVRFAPPVAARSLDLDGPAGQPLAALRAVARTLLAY